MKLAISSYSLWRYCLENHKTIEHAIDWIADSGVGAIEFAGLDPTPSNEPIKRARQLRRRCDKKNVRIVSYCTPGQLLVGPKMQRDAVARLKGEVDIARELGVPSMRHDVTTGFGGYKNYKGKQTFAEALKIVAPAIREVADYGAAYNIKTSLENHGFYMQASKRVEQLIKKVDHPNFGLTIDMGNFLCVNEDPIAAVERLTPYIIMAHAKDFHIKPKKAMPGKGWFETPTSIALRGAIVGHGEIDVPKQLRLLKKSGYKGYLSLEFEGLEEPREGVALGISFLRKHLKKINALDA